MEILFKDDVNAFCIFEDNLILRDLQHFDIDDLANIKHLDDAKILYHYRYEDIIYPVYYELNDRIFTKLYKSYTWIKSTGLIKDYTLVNLRLV